MSESAQKDFFISYSHKDSAWAKWIAWQLEAAGYTAVFSEWDFKLLVSSSSK